MEYELPWIFWVAAGAIVAVILTIALILIDRHFEEDK